MLREGVKCKKNYKNRSGGPSEPQKGNIHRGGGLHIIEKSIYFAKKLTPGAKTPRVGSIRVNISVTIINLTLFNLYIISWKREQFDQGRSEQPVDP